MIRLPKAVAGTVLLAALTSAVWAQPGRTIRANEQIYPGWADTAGGIGINPNDPGTMCCWNANRWMKFGSVDFGPNGYKYMLVNYAAGEPASCFLVPSLDQPPVGTEGGGAQLILDNPVHSNAMIIEGSGGWRVRCKALVRVRQNPPITGTHPLYLFAGRCRYTGGLVDLHWFTFTNDSTIPVYWDWTQPVDLPIAVGANGSTSVTQSKKLETSIEVLSATRSGIGLRLTELGRFNMKILSLSGQLVSEMALQGPGSTLVPVKNLTPGVYMINLTSERKTISRSFVVR